VNRFIDHLQVVTTNNYNTIAISTIYSSLEHTVQCSQSVIRRFLVTAPTMAISLAPAQVLSSQTDCLPYNSSARPMQKHPISNSTSIIARRFVAVGTCLPSRCPETALIHPLVSRSLHGNGSTHYSMDQSLWSIGWTLMFHIQKVPCSSLVFW
jgi:hypothetical protein